MGKRTERACKDGFFVLDNLANNAVASVDGNLTPSEEAEEEEENEEDEIVSPSKAKRPHTIYDGFQSWLNTLASSNRLAPSPARKNTVKTTPSSACKNTVQTVPSSVWNIKARPWSRMLSLSTADRVKTHIFSLWPKRLRWKSHDCELVHEELMIGTLVSL
jgi:hypothetical protein